MLLIIVARILVIIGDNIFNDVFTPSNVFPAIPRVLR